MKKIILLAFAVLSLNAFALNVNVGGSVIQARYVDSTNILKVATGQSNGSNYDNPVYALNVEVTQGFILGELGAGASYEQGYQRGTETFDAVPVYGILRINLFPIAVKPYINAKYGTTIYRNEKNVNMEGGEYLSLGLGLTLLDTLQVEGSLNANKATRNGNDMINGSYGLTVRYIAF